MGAVDPRFQRRLAVAIGRLRESEPQQPALGGSPRVPRARRVRSRRRSRGPLRRQTETMNFADDGVPADADLGGDLAAGQSGHDAAFELLDPFLGPGVDAHRTASQLPRPCWAADRAIAARATGNCETQTAEAQKSVRGTLEHVCRKDHAPQKLRATIGSQPEAMTLYAAITEPHPRLGNASPPL